jgi:casein kinase II subunit alpha
MGRSATKSVARVYADVNSRLGASWYEYGMIATIAFKSSKTIFVDNLQVQWGSQDHYEIVRKVGRGKYSEVSIAIDHETMEIKKDI